MPDSRHLACPKEFNGNEDAQLFVLATKDGGAPWPLTLWTGARSTFVGRSQEGSARFYFTWNKRDKAQVDLYEADADRRSLREVARSKGDVVG